MAEEHKRRKVGVAIASNLHALVLQHTTSSREMPCMLCCCAVPECSAGGFRSLVKQSRSSGYLNLLDRFLWPVLELISGRAPPAAPRQKLEPCCLHLDEAVPDEAAFNDSRRSSKSLVLLSKVSSSITDVQHGVCSVRVVFSCSSSRVLLQLTDLAMHCEHHSCFDVLHTWSNAAEAVASSRTILASTGWRLQAQGGPTWPAVLGNI